jgi:hypothetical protein
MHDRRSRLQNEKLFSPQTSSFISHSVAHAGEAARSWVSSIASFWGKIGWPSFFADGVQGWEGDEVKASSQVVGGPFASSPKGLGYGFILLLVGV